MLEADSAAKSRHVPIREAWLSQVREDAIDPACPIIDAHHHLWDKAGGRYLREEMDAEIADCGHNIVATVFSEGREGYRKGERPELASLGETELVTHIAEASASANGGNPRVAAGIVGYVDLALGQRAGPILDRHIEISGGRFCGVRNTTAWHADPEARGSVILPPPGLAYDREFRAGLRELSRRGLAFDAWMYHTQLGELVDIAHDNPDMTIVVNHLGGPIGIGPYAGRREEVFRDWLHFMRRLSEYENVNVKLGGFGMLMAGFDFQYHAKPPTSKDLAEAWGPYMKACIDAFGASRCLFESNFPVDKGVTSYGVLWNAFKRIAASGSADEKQSLFSGTATRVYRLKLAGDRGSTQGGSS